MRVLSLFDGISCGRVALERAGIPVEKYYASEIDKHAVQVTQKNYPDTVQIGDVNCIDFKEYIGKVDMVIGGSPCTDLSIGKMNREGLEGKQSKLFWKYAEALEVIRLRWFLFENVATMRDTDKDIITETLKEIYPDTECIMINSALLSAQSRRRYYWTNWKTEQPENKGTLLKDILEKEGECSEKKAWALTTRYARYSFPNDFKRCRKSGVFLPVRIGQLAGVGSGQANRIYSVEGKSVCLQANSGGGGGKTGLYKIDLPDGNYTVRKLTPVECERLQTLPDNYTEGISDAQRYKAIGNGWTVDVIAWIFSSLRDAVLQSFGARHPSRCCSLNSSSRFSL